MVIQRVPFQSNSRAYEQYFCGNQYGNGLPVFIGGRLQRGRGLGSILSGLGRAVIPLLKSGGKALLKEGGKAGLQVVGDVLSGQNFKTALKKRARETGSRVFNSALGSLSGRRPPPPGTPAVKRIKQSTSLPRSSHSNRAGQRRRKKTQKRTNGKITGDIFN